MNVEELVRDSLRDMAAEEPFVAPELADRVLGVRRRRRTRRLVAAAVATTAAMAVAVGVPLLDAGKQDVRPAHAVQPNGVHSDTEQWPPQKEIGAGGATLAAYYSLKIHKQSAGWGLAERTYWLLDQKTGRYAKDTRWSYVAVAPGLRTAAVLERTLPAHRIGLLDLTTGEVERWIPVDRGVAGLAFSEDGRRLVATTYDKNPDLMRVGYGAKGTGVFNVMDDVSRTGFFVLDVASGEGPWSGVAADRNDTYRHDFAFSRTGEQVYARIVGARDGMQQFYDLDGNAIAAPADEKYLRSDVPARLSPNGELAALGLAKEVRPGKSYSSIRDPRTGKEITKVRGGELLAWVDDHRLIAWERTTGLDEPYRARLVVVTIGSDKVVPLSGEVEPYGQSQGWTAVFARP
ncbi:WD40 repeat domain-containing protein [Streptomyces sp. NPDC047081]|uniref:WD40 repeat domain-containing protein n=1 Tax=Streptomyces sp. NPDC047081 TaxID=3154706 RepID=UPI0033FFE8C3